MDCPIIIPMFNSEDTIVECLKSIGLDNHWSNNIEVIVIDNNSTDLSENMVFDYCKAHDNCRLLKQPVQGVSAARNLAIKNATGEFVYFMDSDDTLNPTVLDSVLSLAKKENIDCVICDYNLIYVKTGETTHVRTNIMQNTVLHRNYIENQLFLKILTSNATGIPNLWNKIYRRDVISKNHITFDERQIYGEDLLFNLNFLNNAKTIFSTSDCIYNYVKKTTLPSYKKKDYSYSLTNMHSYLQNLNSTYNCLERESSEYLTFINNYFLDIVSYLTNDSIKYIDKKRFVGDPSVHETACYLLKKGNKKNNLWRLLLFLLKYRLCFFAIQLLGAISH